MCKSTIKLISSALHTVDNDELLLKIKGRVALFILTLEVGLLLTTTYSFCTDLLLALGL